MGIALTPTTLVAYQALAREDIPPGRRQNLQPAAIRDTRPAAHPGPYAEDEKKTWSNSEVVSLVAGRGAVRCGVPRFAPLRTARVPPRASGPLSPR